MAIRKKLKTAKGLKRVPAIFANIEISTDTKAANIKLEEGLSNMLDIIIGIVKTNKLLPDANSIGVSVKLKTKSRKNRNKLDGTQPGNVEILLRP